MTAKFNQQGTRMMFLSRRHFNTALAALGLPLLAAPAFAQDAHPVTFTMPGCRQNPGAAKR